MATERITAPIVRKVLDDHLHEHALKLDPKLHDVYHTVFGQQGKGGLCEEVESLKNMDKRLQKIEDGINKIIWIVLLAVLAAVLKLVVIG